MKQKMKRKCRNSIHSAVESRSRCFSSIHPTKGKGARGLERDHSRYSV